jgi:catechol 2,3-dioxygenase-like lactoylglutathione lyase family enzyme
LTIEKLDFIAVPSADVERSRTFYVETLGLRPDKRNPFGFWVGQTDPDGNNLMLHSRYAP